MYDTLILGGRYPDFDRGALVRGEIALKDGTIAALLPPGTQAEAREVLGAAGKIVSPGWIDLHMHEEDFGAEEDYTISKYMALQGVTTCVGGNCGVQYQPLSDFKAALTARGGAPVNYILLAGYNTFRTQAGLGWYEEAPAPLRRSIQERVREELANGAWGLSFGLEYAPGISTEEMTQMAKAIQSWDPFLAAHFRADCEGCLSSLEELALLSQETGCRVQVSHLSSLAGTAHKMPAALDFLEAAHRETPRLGYDTYPYAAFSTGIGTAVFDGDWREKWGVDYDSILLLHPPYTGQRCTKELFEQVRRESPEVNVVAFAMEEAGIRAAVAHPMGCIGSDGLWGGALSHPRMAGTFPRILGRYVREEGVLTWMEALDKMTRQAADRMGLPRRGQIRTGYEADLTIFDPETILDGADFTDVTLPNQGISAVLIHGSAVVLEGVLTGALPGRYLDPVRS